MIDKKGGGVMGNGVSISRLALLSGVLSLGGCIELLSTTPPQITDQSQITAAPPNITLTSVQQNIAYADILIDMYNKRTVDLRNTGYWMTAPLYAAAVAAGAVTLHGANTNVLVDLGLGTGAYYVLNQNLDFSGRAEVLSASTENWRCFKTAAEKVKFFDPKQSGGPDFGTIIQTRKARLDRNLGKAKGYIANSSGSDGNVRAALAAAIALGTSSKPLAVKNSQAVAAIPATLEKYRQKIENRVATLYFGKMQQFSAKATLDAVTGSIKELEDHKSQMQATRNALDGNAGLDPDGKNKQSVQSMNVPGKADDSVTRIPGAPTEQEQKADTNQAKIDNLGIQAATPDAVGSPRQRTAPNVVNLDKKMRAMTYIINETLEQLVSDPETLSAIELPVELAKCVP